jgi:hypothetical protein
VSERRVCGVIEQPRATQRYQATEPDDEVGLTAAIIGYATQYGRYGYRRITALLHRDGWRVNHKRVERIWRQEGLKVPRKQSKRGRLWLTDGSCVRLLFLHRKLTPRYVCPRQQQALAGVAISVLWGRLRPALHAPGAGRPKPLCPAGGLLGPGPAGTFQAASGRSFCFIRKLLPLMTKIWEWCTRRSMMAAAITWSVKIGPQSSKP